MPHVAVVILNYNGRKFLETFLPSVLTHSTEAEVVVADNASTDDSVAFLKNNFPQVRLIINPYNGGFATGYNLALRQIQADYYVLLNSDIEVTPNWIGPIVDLMESNPNIIAVQPKILSYFDRTKFEYAGAAGGFIDKYGYPFCRGRVFQEVETDEGQHDTTIECFWATGACMFVRANLYHELGGLDDAFFAHMEEIDFCWRAKNKGYKVMCCPQSKVYHYGGGTLPKSSWKKTYLNFRNNMSLLMKNLPDHTAFVIIGYRVILDWAAAFKFLIDGYFLDFFAIARAHFSFYRRFPRLLYQRKKNQHSLDGSIKNFPSTTYSKNIVFKHYIEKIKSFSQLKLKDFIEK